MKTLIFLIAIAHAGWFKNLCSKIIADDPNDVPDHLVSIQYSREDAIKFYRAEGGRCYWDRSRSRIQLRGFGDYLRYLQNQQYSDETAHALEDYEFLERKTE